MRGVGCISNAVAGLGGDTASPPGKIVAGPPGFHFLEDSRASDPSEEGDARAPPAERDAALAAGFIVGGANGIAPPMENERGVETELRLSH